MNICHEVSRSTLPRGESTRRVEPSQTTKLEEYKGEKDSIYLIKALIFFFEIDVCTL
jgi:hypothetical protein